MIPRWLVTVATVVAVASYLAWQLAATSDSGGITVLTLITATIFWLSLMVLAGYAVQKGVERHRDRD